MSLKSEDELAKQKQSCYVMHGIDNNSMKYETQIRFRQSADTVGFEINAVFCSTEKMNAVLKIELLCTSCTYASLNSY